MSALVVHWSLDPLLLEVTFSRIMMMMICAHNLFMRCFPILYLHRVFRLYFYHGRLSLCLP